MTSSEVASAAAMTLWTISGTAILVDVQIHLSAALEDHYELAGFFAAINDIIPVQKLPSFHRLEQPVEVVAKLRHDLGPVASDFGHDGIVVLIVDRISLTLERE